MACEQVYQGNMVEVFKISPYFYFRRANLPIRGQCNGAFIVGEREVVILDAPPEGIEMLDEAEELFHKPVTAVLLTHGHTDHVDGLPAWLEKDVTVYCNYRVLDKLVPEKAYLQAFSSMRGRCRADFIGVHDRINLCLADGKEGGIDIELFIMGDTMHSKGDMFVRIPALELVCTGDAVVEYQTAYFHGADIRGWIYSLRQLARLQNKWILPGHNPELLPYSYMTEFADYLSVIERCARICFMRFHPELLGKIDEERFGSVTTDEVKVLVEQFFDERSTDVLFLEEKAGLADARRVVRMTLWEFIREWLR
jgi:glyoxylase-like metal-dependent hydrolase (beta-lactamase superfamily II)